MSSAFRVEASASAEAKVMTLARIPAGSRAGQGLVATGRTRETRRIRLAKAHLDAEALEEEAPSGGRGRRGRAPCPDRWCYICATSDHFRQLPVTSGNLCNLRLPTSRGSLASTQIIREFGFLLELLDHIICKWITGRASRSPIYQ